MEFQLLELIYATIKYLISFSLKENVLFPLL